MEPAVNLFPSILDRMIGKFQLRTRLDTGDVAALRQLPFREQSVEAGRYIVREGSSSTHTVLILSGIAYRHKVTAEGGRQIVSIHIPGDFVDLEGAIFPIADHNIQALTRCELAIFTASSIQELITDHPRIAHAMWVDTLIDGSISREWTVNIGRRTARGRIAHLLCEFARRLEVVGLGDVGGYELPMTQEQLADATGLTPVHVNRTLKGLEREGLYLRLDQLMGARPNAGSRGRELLLT
jgi:CRP-like cAMP-binding protein